jgi:four helix bundle protein
MTPHELQDRTFEFSVRTYKFARPLFRNAETRHLGNQLVRAATSAAANYRSACQARSRKEFCSKIGTVREESDEALFWFQFIRAVEVATGQAMNGLAREAKELASIFAAAYRTAKRRLNAQLRARRTRAARGSRDD